jgi:hypothetical protein
MLENTIAQMFLSKIDEDGKYEVQLDLVEETYEATLHLHRKLNTFPGGDEGETLTEVVRAYIVLEVKKFNEAGEIVNDLNVDRIEQLLREGICQ